MGNAPDDFDNRLARARRRDFLATLSVWRVLGAVAGVAGVLALCGLFVVMNFPRGHVGGTVRGCMTGAFAPGLNWTNGPARLRISARLDDGRIITAVLPKSATYRNNACADFDVYERAWPQGAVIYLFRDYVDDLEA